MKTPTPQGSRSRVLGDFTATPRMLGISLLAMVIGGIATYVAAALLALIDFFTNVFYLHRLSFEHAAPKDGQLGWAGVVVPVVGALIIGLMARYGSERIRGHGIPEALESILVKGSKIEPKVALLKPISSAISIGSGGPFGAEGPIIMTGGAFGSIVAQLFELTSAERKTLLVAGAAAGMSATFASPVAAILLAVELLLFEWKPRSFVPVALASAVAAAGRHFVIGAGPLFAMPEHPAFVGFGALAGCALAGVLAGALSALLTMAVYAAEDLFAHVPIHWMWWPAIGGLVIGVGGLLCPDALGVGYSTIGDLLHESLALRAMLLLVAVKGVIWSTSLGSGTSGGVLAPLLMMGAALGGVESHFLPPEGLGFWPLVSMGAILGGTMRSPFTGIIFAIELTHDMNMLLPLVVAVTIAHAFTVLTLKRSILTEKVARRDLHVSREYAIDVLEVLFVRDVMHQDLQAFSAEALLSEVVDEVAGPRRDEPGTVYPVLDDDAHLVGTVTAREVASWAKDLERLDRPLATFPLTPVQTVLANETLRLAVVQMAEAGVTRLFAMNPNDPLKLVGSLVLHDVLKARVRHLEEERRRERVLPWEYVLPKRVRSAFGVVGPKSLRSTRERASVESGDEPSSRSSL